MEAFELNLFQKVVRWTFTEGTEKWINYAIMPAHNMLFPKNT